MDKLANPASNNKEETHFSPDQPSIKETLKEMFNSQGCDSILL